MATVSLKGVNKSFGNVDVIKDIDLEIAEGEFVVLIGPSGCGKSTLLRMIAGLETISSGELLIDGQRMNDVSPRDRGISMVFQSYALYPHMTVAQNMAFSLKLAGAPEREKTTKVARAAEVLGLGPYLDRFPRQLSGGQRQRVAMGRALVREPSAFLFDEPLSNLDAKLRVKMRAELKELHQTLGTTTIYVTHDQIEAMTLADRIVVLRDGRIEQVGTPLELYDNPANAFVGTFLGSPSMNLFAADVLPEDPRCLRLADGDRITLAEPTARRGAVSVGIRPESFRLVDAGTENALAADVIVVEPTGSMTEIVLRKNGHDFVATFPDRVNLRPGQPVHLSVDPQNLRVFETGPASQGRPDGA
ncbi:sn-glycerol-3-phosphate ABC transporter ATP-binding protein UgpC [Mameliella alba]|nr:sn-glycerol-3-phosphate ABC transporter ATP-binding protein UgpC [Mameliella alba]MBY6171040.1 sn-glycerol-3-phosphate ABC transporter ATP-binding protein UgpC [Mameliella alba]MBY6176264.1 sn-glycerol-3-phosphate ABC transporter ATP-binding protein UgpC [Mameliella alba]